MFQPTNESTTSSPAPHSTAHVAAFACIPATPPSSSSTMKHRQICVTSFQASSRPTCHTHSSTCAAAPPATASATPNSSSASNASFSFPSTTPNLPLHANAAKNTTSTGSTTS